MRRLRKRDKQEPPRRAVRPQTPIRIRPAREPEAPVTAAPPAGNQPMEPGPAPPPSMLLGRLATADRALRCWTDLRAAQPPVDPPPLCRRDPTGALWIAAQIVPAMGAGILWVAGGDAFVVTKRAILPIPGPGAPRARVKAPAPTELDGWPQVPVLKLLAETTVESVPETAGSLVGVLTSAQLAHHIVRTCLAAGMDVRYLPVGREPLFGPGPSEPAVLLDVQAPQSVPATLLRSLTGLPYTVVGRFADHSGRLLVDVGFRLPADVTELTTEIAAGQRWVIGRPGAGAWRVEPAMPGAQPVQATRSLTAPAGHEVTAQTGTAPARRSAEPGQVTLVASGRYQGTADAVLLEERDLDRLKRFLIGQPLAEEGLLIPGNGVYLITESAGLRTALPFGRPLRRVGPGGLYLPDGYALRPPLPPTARASFFGVRSGQLVVVCPDATFCFATEKALWAWELWLPDSRPDFVTGESASSRAILRRVEEVLGSVTAPTSGPNGDGDAVDNARLRRDAIVAEQEGYPERAAALLEEAGHYARAAMVYERLARAEEVQ